MRKTILALLVVAAGPSQLAAQVRCFDCGENQNAAYSPSLMIDYGRGLARAGWGWQSAQITETSVTWNTRVRTGTYHNFFDRNTGQMKQILEHDPGYTNPPYTSFSRCREIKCVAPKY
jgi:hypothetical protein